MEETIPSSVDSLRPSLSASPIVSGKSRTDRLRCNYHRITTVSKCGRTFNKIQSPPILQSCWISHVFLFLLNLLPLLSLQLNNCFQLCQHLLWNFLILAFVFFASKLTSGCFPHLLALWEIAGLVFDVFIFSKQHSTSSSWLVSVSRYPVCLFLLSIIFAHFHLFTLFPCIPSYFV